MATYSSILAWSIPWTEEPGGWATVHGVANSRTRLSTYAENAHIINKYLLYNAGNSTQYSIMAYVGKESLKKWIYVCA